MAASFASPPPPCSVVELAVPAPHVLLVTINRERAMNAIPMAAHHEAEALWAWFDTEPTLRVAVLTGKGTKAFSAGADLMEQRSRKQQEQQAGSGPPPPPRTRLPPGGFLGISRRVGKKPVVAAVNGYALGGGFEIALNCDLVIASPTATFGLTEVKRGLYAAAGGLPRVVQTFGMQLAGEIALTGRILTAQELSGYGFLRIAKSQESLVPEALAVAQEIAAQSPDAVIVSRAALRQAWETASVERAAQLVDERWAKQLFEGENFRIGLEAFAAKKKPDWVPSKF
ncbi:enoyl-CoA hydratase [Xylariales sp. PMI_506]|nr:enoyl-CoA hydratase [Xylariales sp. PMI_506]